MTLGWKFSNHKLSQTNIDSRSFFLLDNNTRISFKEKEWNKCLKNPITAYLRLCKLNSPIKNFQKLKAFI